MDKRILLGARIREIRKRQGLSQEMLAERAGISAQYISNIERGRENPTLDLMLRLSGALKVSLGEICDYETEKMDQKKMRTAILELLRTADPDRLQIAFNVLKAVLR